ncbi:hypothetical protein T01_10081 [Trichinella spiralis]|uniref:Uncharacterized protein n=1 Tax=Trichinella spiralis TaxID=6334 RepID=A0A0V0XDT8_TRISP|nr:hypothetical protein T01_10081 [Trichinella spiralis]
MTENRGICISQCYWRIKGGSIKVCSPANISFPMSC